MSKYDIPDDVNNYARSRALRAANELARRQIEALNLYEAQPTQEDFHKCDASECMLMGGNRGGKALRVDQPVLTPSGWVPIGRLVAGDTVYDGNGDECKVTGVFPQGKKQLYNVVWDDGASVIACGEHLWKCKMTKAERWRGRGWGVHTTDEIIARGGTQPKPVAKTVIPTAVARTPHRELPLDPYTLGCLIGDGSLSGVSVELTTADEEMVENLVLPDGHVVTKKKSGKYAYTLRNALPTYGCRNGKPGRYNEVLQKLKSLGLWGKRSEGKFIPRGYLLASPGQRLELLRGLMDTDGYAGKARNHGEYCTVSPQLAKDVAELVRSLGGKAKTNWRVTKYRDKDGKLKDGQPSARIHIRLWYANPYKLSRKAGRWVRSNKETGRLLERIEPAGEGEAVCISVSSEDRTFITKDHIVTHNSLAAFIEDARALLGRDPYDKYPKKDGVLAIVGYKEWHIGNVVYPYLFKAGAFKIIRDTDTNMWRVYRPWVPQDKAREKESKPAPPLIPDRMIEKIVWKDRGKNVFSNVYLTTGWEIKAFSSRSKPEQGFKADIIHIDEDILDPEWYTESRGRLIDRDGRLLWSALPHDENDAIARFAERAEEQQYNHENGGEEPTTVVLRLSMEGNPYLPAKAKAAAIAGWKSMGDDVYRKRALGELVTDSVLMYPMWNKGVHDIRNYKDQLDCEPNQYLKSREVPLEWCRRLAVDPGHGTGAGILIATPPSGRWHLVFGEIYLHQCNAVDMARALSSVTRTTWYQSFVIDAHGGNLTSMDTGVSPREAYEREMALLDVACVETKNRFVPGCSVIRYREEVTRGMLSIDGSGHPAILVDFEACPNLDREMKRFRKKRVQGIVTDTGNRRSNTHAVECLEYLASYITDSREPYIKPKGRRRQLTPGQQRVRAFKRRQAQRQEAMNPFGTSSTIILGPQGTING